MSEQNFRKFELPDWYSAERKTQKTILQLSDLKELEFYLRHPDEPIRHQALLRLGQLKLKETAGLLTQIMDDSLESPKNKEIAAWALKSISQPGKDAFYIGNPYLDRFTGRETLKDFYYPSFTEPEEILNYDFGASRIQSLLVGETQLVRAESIDESVNLPFHFGEWFMHCLQGKWKNVKLRKLARAEKKRTALPDNAGGKNPFALKRKPLPEWMNPLSAVQEPVAEGISIPSEGNMVHGVKPGQAVQEPILIGIELVQAGQESLPDKIRPASDKIKPGNYYKPFTLASVPEIRESMLPGKRKHRRYVKSDTMRPSFGERIRGFFRSLLRGLLFPFVIIWNQKIVITIVLICLYVFFSFIPFGRMLFYQNTPQLAKMNDDVVQVAGNWFTTTYGKIRDKAVEYKLVRNIQQQFADWEKAPIFDEENGRYVVTAKQLNLRKEPGVNTEKLQLLKNNMIVEYLNESVQTEDGTLWLHVKAPDGVTGWSSADYLSKVEAGVGGL